MVTFSGGGTLMTSSFPNKTDFATGSRPSVAVICDIDSDGKPDIVTANDASNNFSVLRNTSSGGSLSFASKVDFAANSRAVGVTVGDLDRDGKQDVIVKCIGL
jgi:hypothetical protein